MRKSHSSKPMTLEELTRRVLKLERRVFRNRAGRKPWTKTGTFKGATRGRRKLADEQRMARAKALDVEILTALASRPPGDELTATELRIQLKSNRSTTCARVRYLHTQGYISRPLREDKIRAYQISERGRKFLETRDDEPVVEPESEDATRSS